MAENNGENEILISSDTGSDTISGNGDVAEGSVVTSSDGDKPQFSPEKMEELVKMFIQEFEKLDNSDAADGEAGLTFLENVLNNPGTLSVTGQSDMMTPVPATSQPKPQVTVAAKDALNEVQNLVPTQEMTPVPEEFVEFVDLLRADLTNNTTFLSSSTGFRAFDFNFDLTRNGLSSEFIELRKADSGLTGGGGLQNSSSSSSSSTAVTDNGGAALPSSETQPNNDSPSTPPPIKPDLFTAGGNTIDFNTVNLNNYTNNGVYDARAGDDNVILPDIANAAARGFVIGTAFLAGEGNDQVTGGDGNDLIYGNAGNDILNGAGGNDSLLGGAGNDTLTGGMGNDVLIGGADNDLLILDTGSDTATGGTGTDTFRFANITGVDTVADLVTGTDILDISLLLSGWNSLTYAGFFRIVDNGGNADLEVDVDGGGDGFVQIANLIGVNLGAGVTLFDVYAGALTSAFSSNVDNIDLNNLVDGWYVANSQYNAGDGADVVTLADAANEAVVGYTTGNTFYGEAGDDSITGGDQHDKIDGGADHDLLYGNDGDDSLFGGTGNDSLDGGDGNDNLDGGDGNDTLDGGNGNDVLNGGAGDDTLDGGTGTDSLIGGTGNDSYVLGADGVVDRIIYQSGDTAAAAVDTITGFQTGEDIIDISALLTGWDSFLHAGFFRIVDAGADANLEVDADGGADNFVQIATLVGVNLGAGVTLFDIYGGALRNVFTSGDDTFTMTNMEDGWYAAGSQYQAGDGNDTITFGNSDAANTAAGFDAQAGFYGGAGNDEFIFITGGDRVGGLFYGEDGNDYMHGSTYIGDVTADGGDGADTLSTGYGNDTLYGGDGNDTLTSTRGHDRIYGQDGDDVISSATTGNKILIGGAGNDTITVTNNGLSFDYLEGGDGNDILNSNSTSASSNSRMLGGAGIDTLNGGTAKDLFTWQGTDLDGSTDIVNNFTTGADQLDVARTLINYSGTKSDYVRFVDNGGNTVMQIDQDGLAGGFGWVDVAQLNGVTLGGGGVSLNDVETGAAPGSNATGGNDYIIGGFGDETLNGLAGNDYMRGREGSDTIDGGTGNDIIVIQSNDLLNGAVDTILNFETGGDKIDISGLWGGAYDSGNAANFWRLVDDGADARLQISPNGDGAGWTDIALITGVNIGAGIETTDIFVGTALFDDDTNILNFNDVTAGTYLDGTQYYAGDGNDIITLSDLTAEYTEAGFDPHAGIHGGQGDDSFTVGGSARSGYVIYGDEGNDSIVLNAYSDNGGGFMSTLDGGSGNDYLVGSYAEDLLIGGTGNDYLDGSRGNDTLYGDDGDDTLSGNNDDDILYGGAGNDTFNDGTGTDSLVGGTGNDTYTLAADATADRIIYQVGDTAGAAVDTVTGFQTGQDIIDISALLTGWVSINHYGFFQIVDSGADALLQVDADGGGNGFVTIATLMGVNLGAGIELSDIYGGAITAAFTAGVDNVTFGSVDENFFTVGTGYNFGDGDDVVTLGPDGHAGLDFSNPFHGGAGNDTIYGSGGGSANKIIYGDEGNDFIRGRNGNDTLYGGDDNDTLQGAVGDDIVYGDAGNDTLTGEGGNDTLVGGDGDDSLSDGTGADSLIGGVGNDSYILTADGAVDRIIYQVGDIVASSDTITGFQTGEDIIDISALLTGWVSVNHYGFFKIVDSGADALLQVDADGGGDGFVTIATLVGVNLGAGVELTDIYGGAITAAFTSGVDNVVFGSNAGGAVAGFYTPGTQYNAGDGDDVVYTPYSAAHATASGFDVTQFFYGGAGNDHINNGYQNGSVLRRIHGDDGDDSITGSTQGDTLYGDDGNDWIYAASGNDVVFGGDGDDWLRGYNGNDTIDGGAGNDTLLGEAGNDILIGGAGDDSLNSGANVDSLTGGSGSDTIIMGADTATDYIYYTGTADYAAGEEDTITLFETGFDIIDISAVLNGWNSLDHAKFFQIVDNGADAELQVDWTGGGDQFVTIATLTGVNLGAGVELLDIFGGAMSNVFSGADDYMNLNNIDPDWYVGNSQYNAGGGDDYVILSDTANQASSGFTVGTAFYAGAGDDIVKGGDGDDLVFGGSGDDTFFGGAGDDTFDGGTGNDIIVIRDEDVQAAEVDIINNFVAGEDKISLSGFWADYDAGSAANFWQLVNNGADVDVQISAAGNGAGWVTVATVMGVQVGAGITTADISGGDAYFTEAGETFSIHTDGLDGDWAEGSIYDFGAGDDVVTLPGYTANYTSSGFDNTNPVHGGLGNDTINMVSHAQNLAVTIYGDEGNDTLTSGHNHDTLDGGDGDDTLQGNYGHDVIFGGDGNDTLYGHYDNDRLHGGDGDDYMLDIYGYINVFDGGAGDDTAVGGASNIDVFMGGTGADTFTGGNGFINSWIWQSDHLDGSVDTITDFELGTLNSLDVSHLMINFDGTTADYVRFVDNGADTMLQVDRDGADGTYGWEDVVLLTGVTLAAGDVSLNQVWTGQVVGNAFNGQDNYISFNETEAGEYTAGTQYDSGFGNDYIVLPDMENALRSGFVIGTSFYAGAGDDIIHGGDGDDVVFGGSGDDTFYGGTGADTFDGGTGNDIFMIRAEDIVEGDVDIFNNFVSGVDKIGLSGLWDGEYDSGNPQDYWQIVDNGADANIQISLDGSGSDWITVATVTGVNLGAGIELTDIDAGFQTFTDNSEAYINMYTDTNFVDGDHVDGTQYDMGNGDDAVILPSYTTHYTDTGYDGSQMFHGGEGHDYITIINHAQNQDLKISGDGGDDWITSGRGDDSLFGGSGDDYINAHYGNDVIYGGDGNDFIYGSYDNDRMYGGAGNDYLNDTLGYLNVFDGGEGDDIIIGGNVAVETFIGGKGADNFTGGGGEINNWVWQSDHLDGSVDTIDDFELGTLNGLDVSHLMVNFDGTTANYVRFVDDGADTMLQVDRDGAGVTYGWEDVVLLTGVTLAAGDVSLNQVWTGQVVGNAFNGQSNYVSFNETEAGEYTGGTQYDAGFGNDYIVLPDMENALRSGFVIGTDFYAGAGNDIVHGGDGDDVVFGGTGDDTFYGGLGADTFDGGSGTDKFMIRAADIVEGDVDIFNNFVSGVDKIGLSGLWDGEYDNGNPQDYWQIVDNGADANIQISLDGTGSDWITIATVTGVNLGAGIELSDIAAGFQTFTDGSEGTVIFQTDPNFVAGDYVDGMQYDAGNGDDLVMLPWSAAIITATGFDNTQIFHGGAGSDYISLTSSASNLAMNISGDGGDDYIYSGRGDDIILGGSGGDWISGYYGNDLIYGEDGNDSLHGSWGSDWVYGGDGNDYLFDYLGNNLLDGGAGDDTIVGGNYQNANVKIQTFIGGSGADTMDVAYDANGTLTHFIWQSDHLDGSVDTIIDYDLGTNILDISHTLVDYDGTKADYVRFVDDGADTMFQIDRDGSGGVYGWEDVALLTNVTLAGGDVSLDDVDVGDVVGNLFDGTDNYVTFNETEAGEYTAASQYDAGWGNDYIVLPDMENALRSGFVIGTDFYAGAGNDIVHGGDGDDVVFGGQGNDIFYGGLGADTFDGGTGIDKFIIRAADIVEGDVDVFNNFVSGIDKIGLSGLWNGNYDKASPQDFWQIVNSGADALVQISLDGTGSNWITVATITGVNLGAGIELSDISAGFQTFTDGSELDIRMYSDPNFVAGDYVDGMQYDAGNGDDYIVLNFSSAQDTATGFDPNQDFHGGEGNDYIVVTASGSTSVGSNIFGDGGNDEIVGGWSHDYIEGGDGHDLISGSRGNDYLFGNDGNDSIISDYGHDYLSGGDGDDILSDNWHNNNFDGGAGDDVITGAATAQASYIDTFVGGSGSDTMNGNGGYMNIFRWFSDHLDGSVDTITDFELGHNTLDISAVLVNYDGSEADYVRFVDDGADTMLQVDRDGSAGGYGWEDVVLLTGVTLAAGDVSLEDVDAGSPLADLFNASNNSISFNYIGAGQYNAATQYDAGDGNDYVILPNIENATNAGFVIGTAFNAGNGDDVVHGGNGDDVINGGAGDDVLYGGLGADTFDGGADADTIVIQKDDYIEGDIDIINNFATGADKIGLAGLWATYNSGSAADYWQIVDDGADANIQISLNGDGTDWITVATVTGVNLGSGIEISDIQASQYDDAFTDLADYDLLYGWVDGTYVQGTIYDAGAGDDIVTLPYATAHYTSTGFDPAAGFHGGDGNDEIVVTSYAQNGAHLIYGDAGDDVITGGQGADTLYGGTGSDYLFGSIGNDTIYGEAGNDFLSGQNNDDILYGGVGADTLDGGAGADILEGGTGADTLTGGADTDTFKWSAGDFDNAEMDTITDFEDGTEMLDLANLLVGYTGPGDFGDFITIISNGAGGTMVQLDLDGTANGVNFQDFVEITNVADTNITTTDFIMQ